ncbi:hypothetical protein JY97_02655 [Alkalispirochaeta odontotermitis]|nr:hypothetical protein JY97_02655 [Alkalispirochaeta odontotermitis]
MPYLELAFNLPVKQNYTYVSPVVIPIGCRVMAELRFRKLPAWVVGQLDSPPDNVSEFKAIESRIDEEPLFDLDFLELANWLSELTMCSLGEALAAMLPSGRSESHKSHDASCDNNNETIDVLSTDQRDALRSIETADDDWIYLYGISGSGKTEVFLRIAQAVIERGGSVIYLVPEIALIHHLVGSLKSRFQELIAELHSALSPSERLSEWRRIQSGSVRFVFGTRSAVFAPMERLELIIIDEEHDSSYKSNAAPRYHARQVAMRRCKQVGARLLMGSATPSLEVWQLVKSGSLKSIKLADKPAGGASPVSSIVDLRKERTIFSGQLIDAISRVLGGGRQVLLFLNRRGFSYQFSCQSCGEGVLCRNCSVPLIFHKSTDTMNCHYCGFGTKPIQICPNCGSLEMKFTGFGTERAEEEIRRLFPEKRVARLDTDVVRKRNELEKILRHFEEGDIDVLLGTQMIAKGLNAPGLKLVGVLFADSSLNLPDFRAAERTFALIVQVSGRTGRFLPDGEVIVQTLRPEAAAIQMAVEGRLKDFYEYELGIRKTLHFPPFCRIFRILFEGKNESRVCKASEKFASTLSGTMDEELLGPAECAVARISGRYRRHLLLRSDSFDITHATLASALSSFPRQNGVRIKVDVDPTNLL